jgi:GDPmannose 4,6-dehydratase
MTIDYREGYNIFACNGIMFNHESPRRGETFVTRKITRAIAAIKAKKQDALYLGNLDAKRDWGYAPEYVEFMWKILQHDKPEDFVLGTGEAHSVREFLEEAFSYVDLNLEKYIKIDPRYFRPTEVEKLVANPAKARKILGWYPKITFKNLVKVMVDADMRAAGFEPPGEGDKIIRKKFPKRWWGVD